MIKVKNYKQKTLFDPWNFISPKRRKLLDESWAGLFQKELLCELPVNEMIPFFNNCFGRPTKELHTALGVLLLQQILDLTDNDAVEQLAFNIQWHYALNISEESDSAKYMCPKTLWNMRSIVIDNALDKMYFERITDKLAEVFNVNTDNQRIDSVHIKSNMRRLGRISIFSESIHGFLINLKRSHEDYFNTVDQKTTEKYLTEKGMQCFAMVKPSESAKTLATVSDDLFNLIQQFKSSSQVKAMHTYKLLERVLSEQCIVNESDKKNPVKIKKPKDIPSDSLQNPSDADATYDGHKGQGYQVQVMETYCKDEKSKKTNLNLITHVQVDPAHESDANALIPAIQSTTKQNLAPKELLADSLYGSDSNCQEAEKLDVELIAPPMGNKIKGDITLSNFEISEKGEIVSCPQKIIPVRIKKKKTRYSVAFDSKCCNKCPLIDECPVKHGKEHHYLRYTDKEMRLAQRRAYGQTKEFKDRYRWRAGVEATMSEYDRKTGVKRLRVRGLKSVHYQAILKAIGINIFRATAVRKALKKAKLSPYYYLFLVNYTNNIIKELFLKIYYKIVKNFSGFLYRFNLKSKIAEM